MKKIVILNGSARKGNTYACINAFVEGAKAGNEIEIIETDKVNVSPCKGCPQTIHILEELKRFAKRMGR